MQQTYNCIVADDDDIDRLTTLSYIRDYPFLNVTGNYASSQDALAAAQVTLPDILFLDIDMPGMSGLELLENIKQKYHMPPPVVMMITAYGDAENYNMAKKLGADDFLTKPVDFTLLKEKLKTQFS